MHHRIILRYSLVLSFFLFLILIVLSSVYYSELFYFVDKESSQYSKYSAEYLTTINQLIWEETPSKNRGLERIDVAGWFSKRVLRESVGVDKIRRRKDFPHFPDRFVRLQILDAGGRTLFDSHTEFIEKDLEISTSLKTEAENWEPIKLEGQLVGFSQISTIESEENLRPFQRILFRIATAVSLTTFFFFIFGALMSLIVIRDFMVPIEKLTAGAMKVAHGNYAGLLPPISIKTSELKILYTSFNNMLEKIRRRNEWRDNFLDVLSHDLRTPLTLIRGELELMKFKVVEPTPEQFQSMESEILFIESLIGQIEQRNDFVKGVENTLFDLVETLDDITLRFEPRAREKSFKIEWESQRVREEFSQPIAYGNAQVLTRVMYNLLENSLKYSDSSQGLISIQLTHHLKEWYIDVRDRGKGIPEGELGDIFEWFYRLEESRNRKLGGRGIGLAISQEGMHAIKGDIYALKSETGAWFRLTLREDEEG